jgi:hypothetical protein
MSICKKCRDTMLSSNDAKTEWCVNPMCENIYLVFTTWRPSTLKEKF